MDAMKMLVRREFEDIGDLRTKVLDAISSHDCLLKVAEALVLWETYAPPSEHVMVSLVVVTQLRVDCSFIDSRCRLCRTIRLCVQLLDVWLGGSVDAPTDTQTHNL
jgi:hypothetical protein